MKFSFTSYDYDGFNRMTNAYRNGTLIQSAAYNHFDNSESSSLDFAGKAHSNNVLSTTHLNSTDNFGVQSHVDPLGRKVASNKLSSGDGGAGLEDIIYDMYDRPILSSPPGTSGPSIYVSYPNANYAETEYDVAPRSRPLKSSKFGESISGDHVVNFEYCITDDIASELTPAGQHTIPPGTKFFRSKTTDEDGKSVIEFSNALGQKVATITNNGTIATSFLYDSYGNVKEVSNPKNQPSEYHYNYLGQLYEKTTVDAGTVKYVYNPSGQLWFDQDELLGGEGYARMYDYDEFGRMVAQAKVQTTTAIFENEGNPWIGTLSFSDGTYDEYDGMLTASTSKMEKRWIYDDYDDSMVYADNAIPYLQNSLTNTLGNLVQTISYNLPGEPIEYKFMSYNDDGFLKWEMNQFNNQGIGSGTGMLIRIDYPEYNRQGSFLKQNIDLDGDHDLDFQYAYEYDSWNRIKNVYANYDDSGDGGNMMVEYFYDNAKQVVERKTYRHFAEDPLNEGTVCANNRNIDYTYDDRVRLTKIKSSFFDWYLHYDEENVGAPANYNGNINGATAIYKFNTAANAPDDFATYNRYRYYYDDLNRLTKATASIRLNGDLVAANWGRTEYQYDKIGNITRLDRRVLDENGVAQLNRYNYNYGISAPSKNKLLSINAPFGSEWSPDAASTRLFTYDENGNLSTDDGRNISSTEYGRANLPWEQTLGGNTNKYLYDVSDARIYKVSRTLSRRGATSEYYLRDATGKEIAVYNFNTNQLTWYVHGNERVAKIGHHSAFIPNQEDVDPCDPESNPRCRSKDVKTDFFDPNLISTTDATNNRIRTAIEAMSGEVTGDLSYTNFPVQNKLYHVQRADGVFDYSLEANLVNLDPGYQVLEVAPINSPHQLFEMSLTNGQNAMVSVAEILLLPEEGTDTPPPFPSGDPFNTPLDEMDDAPLPLASYYIHDHLGNTRVMYHLECQEGSAIFVLEHVVDYYPYGKILREYLPSSNPEKYLSTHHERDQETGLDYRGARMYDSDIGRFLSLDPLAADYPDVSAYNYVLGNPIFLIDPSGRNPEGWSDTNVELANEYGGVFNDGERLDDWEQNGDPIVTHTSKPFTGLISEYENSDHVSFGFLPSVLRRQ